MDTRFLKGELLRNFADPSLKEKLTSAEDEPLCRSAAIDKTTKRTKALGLIGGGLYIGLQLSYFFGVSGDLILNIKGKRKWKVFSTDFT